MLAEVIDLFPSRMIHIGGDEVPHKLWESTLSVADFMAANQLPQAKDLQLWFLNRISKFLQSKECTMMGWNEITGDIAFETSTDSQSKKLADGTVIQFWNGDADLIKKSIERGYKIINFNRFLDYADPPNYKTVGMKESYSFSPIPDGLNEKDQKNIWGLGCQLLGEYNPSLFNVFPRIAAHAETGWTASKNKNYDRFFRTVPSLRNLWLSKALRL